MKGIVALGETPEARTIVQMVGRRIQMRRGEPWDATPPQSRLIVIGSPGALSDDELVCRLNACIYRTLGERVRETFATLRHRLSPLFRRGEEHAR